MDLGKRLRCFRIAAQFLALVALAAASGGGQAADLTKGSAWLSSQIVGDGSLLGEGTSIATALQCREEALLTLRKLGSGSGALTASTSANAVSSASL